MTGIQLLLKLRTSTVFFSPAVTPETVDKNIKIVTLYNIANITKTAITLL